MNKFTLMFALFARDRPWPTGELPLQESLQGVKNGGTCSAFCIRRVVDLFRLCGDLHKVMQYRVWHQGTHLCTQRLDAIGVSSLYLHFLEALCRHDFLKCLAVWIRFAFSQCTRNKFQEKMSFLWFQSDGWCLHWHFEANAMNWQKKECDMLLDLPVMTMKYGVPTAHPQDPWILHPKCCWISTKSLPFPKRIIFT